MPVLSCWGSKGRETFGVCKPIECAELAPLRANAELFNDNDHTMRSLFAQQDHMSLRVFHYVIDCLNFKLMEN